MLRNTALTILALAGLVLAAACQPQPVSPTTVSPTLVGPTPVSPTPVADMPNPASVYCEQNGGRLELRQDASGGVAGVCVFPDGSECDEWAYFRGECGPGDSRVTAPAPTAEAELAEDGWKVYRNEALGYSLHYPADATLDTADDPLKTLTITGPMAGDENWPVIYFSHPGDREEYRPPEGVDLEQWLVEHNLLLVDSQQPGAETRQPDVSIAGSTAIHTRLPRSPQTYAYDKYFFARSGQLYVVVLLHAGDKEDWELYNHFLESIQFES